MTPTLVASRTALPPEGAVPPKGGLSAELTHTLAASRTGPTPLLDVRGLRISFAGQEVVRGIDFFIAAGEKVALVGESGSGKTVTALSLLRLVQNADVGGVAHFIDPASRPVDRDL